MCKNTTAIIVSYKNEELTSNFVNDELSKCIEVNHVVVVNNAAGQESNEKLSKFIKDSEYSDGSTYTGSKVVIISNADNVGFARGNNDGARYAQRFWNSDFYLFTNDDIIITDDAIVKKLSHKLNEDEKIGCIGPKVIFPWGERQGPSYYYGMWTRLKREIMIRLKLKKRIEPVEGYCYTVKGCFFMARANDFHAVGMMDENTFLFREEECLSERLKGIGKQSYWMASVEVIHTGGKSVYSQGEEIMEKKRKIHNIFQQSDKYYLHTYFRYPYWEIEINRCCWKLFHRLNHLKK